MNAFEVAEKNGRAGDLQKELEALVQHPEQEPKQGYHVDSCHLPPRCGFALRGIG